MWEEPALARLFDRRAEFSRLILMDRRGTGLSDPIDDHVTLADEVDDLIAVLDAAGSERTALHAVKSIGDGFPSARPRAARRRRAPPAGRAWASRTAACTRSRACRGTGRCSRSSAEASRCSGWDSRCSEP
jgi:hypothetical protein